MAKTEPHVADIYGKDSYLDKSNLNSITKNDYYFQIQITLQLKVKYQRICYRNKLIH